MGTDIHGVWQARMGGFWEDVPSLYEQDRDYLLFAWLGNVRNGFGFAGIKTHTPIVPLTDCRGLPADFKMSNGDHPAEMYNIDPRRREWLTEDEKRNPQIWMGDHSFSWVAVDEVLAAADNYMPNIVKFGVVTREQFSAWDGVAQPDEYCANVVGHRVLVKAAKCGDTLPPEVTHVRVSWQQSIAEPLAYFINECRRLKAEYDAVRFVFGFDS